MNILRPLFRDRSFAFKFTLLTTIPVMVVGLSIALLVTHRLEQSVTDATFVRVKRNTYLAALSMSNPYVIYNKALLDSFVDGLKQEKDISYAFVVDYNDGRILAHNDHGKDGGYYEKTATTKNQIIGTGTDGIVELPDGSFEAVSPIYIAEDMFGTVKVGFSLESVYKEIASLRVIIAGITLLAIIFSVFLSVFLARLLSKPLLLLAFQAQKIAEGNFDQTITYDSRDVVGELSGAFKKMMAELKNRLSLIESNEKKYRALFEASNDAVLILDEKKIIDCNQQAHQIFKGKSKEIILKTLEELSPEKQPDGRSSGDVFNKKIIGTLNGERHRFDWKHSCLDGTALDAEVSLSRTIISDKKMVLAVVQDITERKAAEAEIDNLNQTLEKRVEERTSDLEDAQEAMLNLLEDLNTSKEDLEQINLALSRSEKKAEEANRAKSEFLANMSHEIRTPLNAIVGLTYLTRQTKLTPQQNDYLLKIDSSAETLLSVINDILDFSKIEAGKLTMESFEFYLEDVLNKTADMVAMKAEEKGIELIFSIDNETPQAFVGDPLRLGQVLINLVGNAVKFTEKGEVVIQARLLEERGEQVKLQFDVRDTGIGLSEENINKLFQAFTQADTSTSRQFGGTGLGLVISKRIVEIMGGDINLESELGKGSTFSFTVLLGRSKNVRLLPVMFSEDFKGMRALIVDDSRTARHTLKRILESFKLKVTLADSGKEALEILENDTAQGRYFDMVFTDYKMPIMDGLETAGHIKNNNSLARVPVMIMVTAYGRNEILHQAEQLGLDGFITKPVSPSTILDSIMNAFGNKSGLKKEPVIDPEKPARGLGSISGARILLAEDNEVNQQVACELLSSVGLDVTIAKNGKIALEKVQNEPFDAILMDVQMPEMDGLTATKKIRALDQIKDIPIIALTAHAMTGDRAKSLQAGMNDHITKPLDPEELFEALVKWIKPVGKPAVIRNKATESKKSKQLFPELPGFDTVSALARVGGNHEALFRLLKKFSSGHSDALNKTALCLKEDNSKEARERVHALRGVAGNIGAVDLHKVLTQFEYAIHEGRSDTWESLLKLSRELLTQTFSSIRQLDTFRPDNNDYISAIHESAGPDMKKIRTALSETKKCLEDKSFSAGKSVESLGSLLKGCNMRIELADLEDHVAHYRFTEALNTIDMLAETLNIN